VLQIRRLENIVKKHGEIKAEVEDDYTAGLIGLFAVSALACIFVKGVVTMRSSKPITMEVSAGCSTDLCPTLL